MSPAPSTDFLAFHWRAGRRSRRSTARQLVTLAPGQVASALLRIVDAGNYAPAKCGPVTASYLQVYPPNQTRPGYLSYKSTACSKPVQILTVNVVLPGSGG